VLLVKLDAVDAETVAAALRTHIQALPAQLRQSLTWDQGTEMARHVQFTVDLSLATDMGPGRCHDLGTGVAVGCGWWRGGRR
jgi:hypothetical protein